MQWYPVLAVKSPKVQRKYANSYNMKTHLLQQLKSSYETLRGEETLWQQSRDGGDWNKLNRLVHHRKHATETLKNTFRSLSLSWSKQNNHIQRKKSLQKNQRIISTSSYSCCNIYLKRYPSPSRWEHIKIHLLCDAMQHQHEWTSS